MEELQMELRTKFLWGGKRIESEFIIVLDLLYRC